MRKLLILTIALLFLMVNHSFAEFEIKTSLKGGAIFNWILPGISFADPLTGFKRELDSSPYITGTGGGFIEFSYLFEGIFILGVGLEIGLSYTGRGAKRKDGLKEEAHYIGIPIILKMQGPFTKYLWTGLGVSYNRLLAHKAPLSIVLNKDLVELIYGLGFYIPITSVMQIVGEIRGYFGLTHYDLDKSRTIGVDIMLGVAFKVY